MSGHIVSYEPRDTQAGLPVRYIAGIAPLVSFTSALANALRFTDRMAARYALNAAPTCGDERYMGGQMLPDPTPPPASAPAAPPLRTPDGRQLRFRRSAWGYIPSANAPVVIESIRHTRTAVEHYLDEVLGDVLETDMPLGTVVPLEIYQVLPP